MSYLFDVVLFLENRKEKLYITINDVNCKKKFRKPDLNISVIKFNYHFRAKLFNFEHFSIIIVIHHIPIFIYFINFLIIRQKWFIRELVMNIY